ncbi:MAG: hypothetical protein COV30_02295 [Candidatus Yanofskybacteria bacterium CG10_big_fil_rev_8_21_14_0_10_37_15]|uniref:GH15-like domain-containing protein n=1 Tax=Candidatus Yanofskybacteria bacterium CG10_big_fil_rev_8_21_14_0_10_37_15 TaxID=1975097 RepID=A0A2H0R5B8_9BACT|nr:MAG: hypothetical protein COV30_02295 [Candidatus Yanofskybacteria bacterium CG10_big_fil_rev_8_21_14_0_10_37_15]
MDLLKLIEELEKLRRPSGAFIAASSNKDYQACWLRDHLYNVLAYYYLGEFEKLQKGVWVAFDILHKYLNKINKAICHPPSLNENVHEFIHAKYHPDTFNEIDNIWGHHQLDTLGLLFHVVADLDFKNIKVIRNKNDLKLIQLLVFYLLSVKFWENPDNGMWEEGPDLHSSSIGSVVAGLSYIDRREIVVVPPQMISMGKEVLNSILPRESFNREVDMAQLSLIWPYNIISRDIADVILSRVKSKLVQPHGLYRYQGDTYLGDRFIRSQDGVSAQWPIGFFWLSIIYSQRHEIKEAGRWFERGIKQVIFDNQIPEAYVNNKPNKNFPLAWAHSLAIIALKKIETENKQTITSQEVLD